MNETEVLAALYAIRSTPAYRTAECLRQKKGNTVMAAAAAGTDEKAAVDLLISTWETIALMVADVANKDKIFEVTPVGYMFDNLKEAILLGRSSFAANFFTLAGEYTTWVLKRGDQYQTQAAGGMHALFG